MIASQLEPANIEQKHVQEFGAAWIRAITEAAFDRLEEMCQRKITGRLLIPPGLVTITKVEDLIAEYRDWFGGCTDFNLEVNRVDKVGEKIGIFYRFLLRDQGEWYRIEQQLFCVLKDGIVHHLDLLCSGFQPVGADDQATI